MTNCHYPRLLLLAAASALLAQCASTTEVVPVDNVTTDNKGGTVYNLPETALLVEVPLTRKEKKPGEFAFLAVPLFGVEPDFDEHSVEYGIGDTSITPEGVPDPRKVYFAKISGGPMTEAALSLQMGPRGILNAATTEAENKTVDFVVAALEGAVKIAGAAALAGEGFDENLSEVTQLKHKNPGDAARVKKLYERAVKTAALYEKVLTGGAMGAGDLPSFEARLKKAEEMLAEAMGPFYGTISQKTWPIQFSVLPSEVNLSFRLFTYSGDGVESFGIEPKNRKMGALLKEQSSEDSKQPQKQQSAPPTTEPKGPVDVVVEVSNLKLPAGRMGADFPHGHVVKGIRYNIPASGTITLFAVHHGKPRKTEQLLVKSAEFGQYGSIGFLPTTTGSRKLKQEVTLDPVTGALLKISNTSGAFDSALVTRTTSSIAEGVKAAQ